MNVNPLRSIWNQGRPAVGSYIMYSRDVATVEIAAAAGLHFVIFDLEHRPLDTYTIHDLCQVARLAGMAALVGPKDITTHAISHALDLGASGVVIPHVRTPAEVEIAIKAVRYPPIGRRGRCGTSGHDLYHGSPADEEISHYNQDVALMLKVESEEAIDQLDDLVAPVGVDGMMVGPSDLALDLGLGGQSGHPKVKQCIEKVRKACRNRGIQFGTFIGSADEVPLAVEQGASWIVVNSELGFLAESWKRVGESVA